MKAKSLLVDDYPGIRNSLGRALRLEGYDVTPASDGCEALALMRDWRFDLVLFDLDLPLVHGWKTLERLLKTNPPSPVIIMTACLDQQWLTAQAGVAAVLEKPLDMAALLESIQRALALADEDHRRRTALPPVPAAASRPKSESP